VDLGGRVQLGSAAATARCGSLKGRAVGMCRAHLCDVLQWPLRSSLDSGHLCGQVPRGHAESFPDPQPILNKPVCY
jgi:hypothetical protein